MLTRVYPIKIHPLPPRIMLIIRSFHNLPRNFPKISIKSGLFLCLFKPFLKDVKLIDIKYSPAVVQHLPSFISRNFASSQTEALYLFIK